MVVRHESWPTGTPAWIDISVTDLERSQAFYRAVLGWEFGDSDPEMGGYTNAMLGSEVVAGMAPRMEGMEEGPHVWTTYLAVEDAGQVMQQVTDHGGQVVFPVMEVGSFGTMAMATDPTGAAFGVWQAGEHTGVDVVNEPGSLVWNDAMVGDLEAGKTFYADVFGYHYADMPGAGTAYVTASLEEGSDPVCGLGQVEEGQAPSWSTNFAVADADATVQRVTEAGGGVVMAPFDFEYGRMAVVTGPDGETFGVVNPPAS